MISALRTLGYRTVMLLEHLGHMAAFVGEIGLNIVRPPFRFGRLVMETFDVGVLSLAIVCLSGATVGAVLGLQGYNTLTRFGAEGSLGAVVGLTLVRELGPVFTALLVTGRAGSAMAFSSSRSSLAKLDTSPAPATVSSSTDRPDISPTSWSK